jgi:uncharacterized protein (TIGR04255 family)
LKRSSVHVVHRRFDKLKHSGLFSSPNIEIWVISLVSKVAAKRKYKNPPITEAVCEFKVVPTVAWDLTIPGRVYERLSARFPKTRQAKAVQATIGAGGAVATVELERLQCLQQDEKALISISKDAFGVSRLVPYLGWDNFRPTIHYAYRTYADITKPTDFQRVGLRYINRIDFKQESIKLEDFFEFHPFVGNRLPQEHGSFITAIQYDFNDARDSLRLQLATANVPPEGFRMSLILDLDYFLAQPAKIEVTDLMDWLESAHTRLGEIFEGCISDKLRERFEVVQ